LRKRTALYTILGGTSSSLVWRILQPLDMNALFVGLGCSLLVAVVSEVLHSRSR
jgi:hypothetical protein